MMMVALVLGLALLPQASSKPDIFLYFSPGMTLKPIKDEPWIAIWKSGRVMWRDPEPEWARRNGDWALPPAKYYESKIDPKRVEAALRKIDGVAKEKSWYYAIPDSHTTCAEIRLPGRVVKLGVTDELPATRPAGWTEKQWLGRHAWTTTLAVVKGLIPAKTKLMSRVEWMKPLKMSDF